MSKTKKLGGAKSVKLFDSFDRTFTLESGVTVKLEANTPAEVSSAVAKELLEKYPYLKVVS